MFLEIERLFAQFLEHALDLENRHVRPNLGLIAHVQDLLYQARVDRTNSTDELQDYAAEFRGNIPVENVEDILVDIVLDDEDELVVRVAGENYHALEDDRDHIVLVAVVTFESVFDHAV